MVFRRPRSRFPSLLTAYPEGKTLLRLSGLNLEGYFEAKGAVIFDDQESFLITEPSLETHLKSWGWLFRKVEHSMIRLMFSLTQALKRKKTV